MTAGSDNFYFRLQSSGPAGLAGPGTTSAPAAGSPAGQASGGKIRAGSEQGRSDSSARGPLPRPATTAETTAETTADTTAVQTTG